MVTLGSWTVEESIFSWAVDEIHCVHARSMQGVLRYARGLSCWCAAFYDNDDDQFFFYCTNAYPPRNGAAYLDCCCLAVLRHQLLLQRGDLQVVVVGDRGGLRVRLVRSRCVGERPAVSRVRLPVRVDCERGYAYSVFRTPRDEWKTTPEGHKQKAHSHAAQDAGAHAQGGQAWAAT